MTATLDDGNGTQTFVDATVGLTWEIDRWAVLTVRIPDDLVAPSSQASQIAPTHTEATVDIAYTADDQGSGVEDVEVWSRYRVGVNDPWSAWTLGASGGSSPITYTFGPIGFYEFYTVATDRAGNRESAPAAGDASTQLVAPSDWSTGVRINDDGGTADQIQPTVVVGPDAAAYAAWWDARADGAYDIFSSKRDPATGTWGPSVRVNDVATGGQTYPSLAVDGSGNIYAVWVDQRNSGRKDIYFSKRSAANGTWSANVRVHSDTTFTDQSRPDIAVSSTGEVIVAWYRKVGTNKFHIYSARLPAGSSTWSALMKISSDQSAAKDNPDIVIGSDGTAYAAWHDARSGNVDVWFATLASGASVWSTNAKVSDDPGTASQTAPNIGIDAVGNLTVVWDDWRSAGHELRARKRPAGSSTWAASIVVSSAGSNSPSLSVRADGRGYVVWHDGINALFPNVWGSELAPATFTWSTPEKLNDTGPTQPSAPAGVGLGPSQLIVVWQNGTNVAGDYDYDIRARFKAAQ